MGKEKILRRLVIKSFHINNIEFSEKNSINKNLLKVDKK